MAAASCLPAIGVYTSVEVSNTGNARGRIDESRGGKVEVVDVQLGLKWGGCCIIRVDGARLPIEFPGASSGQIGRQREGKLRGEREVLNGEFHVLVHPRLGMQALIGDGNQTILDAEFPNRQTLQRLARTGRCRLLLRGSSAEARKVPLSGACSNERDFGLL